MAYLRLGHIKESSGSNKSAGLKKCIDYIFNPLKTEDKKLIGGYNISVLDNKAEATDSVYNQMLETKIAYDKTDGRQGYHYKLSFPENEKITPELAMQITNEFCEECFTGYECAYAVHTNTKHLHSHIVFNSVNSFDGYKYQYHNGDWAKKIQPAANRICIKYGLSSLDLNLDEDFTLKHKCKDYGSWKKQSSKPKYDSYVNNGGRYTKSDIISDIDDCINMSSDWLSFVKNMEDRGHKLDDSGKYLKVLAPGRKKWCRTYNLTDDKNIYSKQEIIRRIKGIPTLDYKAVKEKLFSDWKEYTSVIVVKSGKRLSVDELQKIEELDLLQKNKIQTKDDLLLYTEYLNQADKLLNIYRKKINSFLASKQKYIETFDYISKNSKQLIRYLNGDTTYKNVYEKAKNSLKELTDNGYNAVELYRFIVNCNTAIDMIDKYKKHIYVERKIAKRVQNGVTEIIKSDLSKK